jgi:uncharacterized protein YdaU (DUF1376 family)
MAEFPSLPLFTDAYLADTEHLDDAQHGIYLRLLMLMWRTPGCRIPNDDDWIARRMRKPVESVRRNVRPILEEFCCSTGNWLIQKRLRKEFFYLMQQRQQRTVAANARWHKGNGSSGADISRISGKKFHRNAPHLEVSKKEEEESPNREEVRVKSAKSANRRSSHDAAKARSHDT